MCKVHKFELAGLGKAPYRLGGVVERKYQACYGAPVQPGSTCDYCHTSIMYEYWIHSSDGKRFKVGCDCVLKTDSERSLVDAVKREANRIKTEARHAKEDARIAEGVAWFTANREAVAKHPHPYAGRLRDTVTLADYVDWCLGCGRSGKLAALAMARRAVETSEVA